MPIFLSQRSTNAREWMDDPDCNQQELFRTYRQFSTVNTLISRWSTIYRRLVLPQAQAQNNQLSLLDIGFGGGDIPIKLARWAQKDDIDLEITGIETDARALEFVNRQKIPPKLTFRHLSAHEMLALGQKFDIVISNHLLHHLGQKQLFSVLSTARQLSQNMVLFNDIERSDAGWLLFNIFARPLFRSSFVTHDGLISIRRSYTRKELAEIIPEGWTVSRLFPFRLLLSYQHA